LQTFIENGIILGIKQIMNFKEIIQFAVENNFQELFLTVGSKPSLRIHKEIIEIENLAVLNSVMIENLLLEIISENQLNTIKEKEHLNFHYKISDLCDLKVFISFSKNHSFVKITNLNQSNLNISELNLTEKTNKIIEEKSGLFIISGEKFDGKTSTLRALIEQINKDENKQVICILQDEELIKVHNQNSIIINSTLEEIQSISPDILVIDNLNTIQELIVINELLNEGKKIITSIYAHSVIQTIQNICNIDTILGKKILGQHLKMIINMEVHKSKADQKLYPLSEIFILEQENSKMIQELDYSQIQNHIETGKNQGMHTKKQDITALQNLGLI